MSLLEHRLFNFVRVFVQINGGYIFFIIINIMMVLMEISFVKILAGM